VPDGSLWKRRKIEHDQGPSKESSEEPRVKEETPEEDTSAVSTVSETSSETAVDARDANDPKLVSVCDDAKDA